MSPSTGLRAVAMVRGWSGLALVCSTITFSGFSVFTKPYSVSSFVAASRVRAENLGKLIEKFTYPPPAGDTFSVRWNFDLPVALASCSARSIGFCPTFLASSKHKEEASWPNSGFGGFSRARFDI